jgi:hypothetical protein
MGAGLMGLGGGPAGAADLVVMIPPGCIWQEMQHVWLGVPYVEMTVMGFVTLTDRYTGIKLHRARLRPGIWQEQPVPNLRTPRDAFDDILRSIGLARPQEGR